VNYLQVVLSCGELLAFNWSTTLPDIFRQTSQTSDRPLSNILRTKRLCPISAFKSAYLTPLLKKSGLDLNEACNYRPVSNLSFLSKILEKAVSRQLDSYLTGAKLFSSHQSAYRKFHSTETDAWIFWFCSLNLHKGSFIIKCLFKFIDMWTCFYLCMYY